MAVLRCTNCKLAPACEGGKGGGKLEFAGIPEEMVKLTETNYTANTK
jgi:excinuclease UvrABC ATPase subunit